MWASRWRGAGPRPRGRRRERPQPPRAASHGGQPGRTGPPRRGRSGGRAEGGGGNRRGVRGRGTEARREHLMATNHSREVDCELEIASTRDGVILGLRGHLYGDMGAYIRTNGGVVPAKAAQFLPGPYRIRDVAVTVEV